MAFTIKRVLVSDKTNSRHPHVKLIQGLLLGHGFDPGKPDGIFGPKTKAATKAFQKNRGLVSDGIVGSRTWTALELAE